MSVLPFSAWSDVLTNEQMNQWLQPYEDQLKEKSPPKTSVSSMPGIFP